MKHYFPFLFIMLWLCASTNVLADDFEIDGLLYQKVWGSDTEVEVTCSYENPYTMSVINIPSSIVYEGKTYKVTQINRINEGYENEYIKEIIIPESVTLIKGLAFSKCTALTSIVIPDNVTEAHGEIFDGCKSLKNITLGNGITTLSNYGSIFGDCPAVENITLGSNLTYIGGNFTNFSKLKSVKINASNEYLKDEDGIVYSKDGSILYLVPAARTAYTMPNDVKEVASYAFYGPTLSSVTFGAGITEIDYGFYSCSGLKSISFGDNVERFHYDAFNCPAVTDFIVSEGNQTYKSVDGALYSKDGETLLRFPSGKESYTAPAGVKAIGEDAFSGSQYLKTAVLMNDVTNVQSYAFNDCKALQSLTLGDNVISLGYSAISSCPALTTVNVGNGLTTFSLRDCDKLTTIVLGDGITSFSFENCPALTAVTIGAGITSLDWGFIGCPALSFLYVSESNTMFQSIDGVLYSKDGKTFMRCPIGRTSCVIPNGVTTIGARAFADCSGLTSITIPESVTSIEEYAFYECSSLTSITIPESVTNIEEGAFFGCDSLTSIIIPESVASIGNFAFYGCSSLTSINIPESVTSIEEGAFWQCSSLTTITIPESVTSIGGGIFSGCKQITEVYCIAKSVPVTNEWAFDNFPIEDATLYVPEGSVEAYKASYPWSEFGTIVGLTQDMIDGIEDIEDSATLNIKETWYSLDGKRLVAPQKGINIINGKKILK